MKSFEEFVERDLAEAIEHRGDQWVVLTHDRKRILGTHPTEKEAQAQLAAIEISKHAK